jgi:hypothetical protein
MKDQTETQLRKDLSDEITALEKRYRNLKDYLEGAQMETFEVMGNLRAYKDDLSVITAHVLALYQLRGQRAKTTWDSLFTNIDTALETIQNRPRSDARTAIGTALNMSTPKIEEVMAFLLELRKSL